jgi:hypothetical protein
MRLILSLLVLMAAAGSDAASPVKRKTIPSAFHGDWVLETRECAVGPTDSGNMRISARKLSLFEMVGKVMHVTVVDPQNMWVKSRITHGNTAYNSVEVFDNLEMMSLSPDGQKLTTGEGEVMQVYKRCLK